MVELPVEALEGGLSMIRLDDGRVAIITSIVVSAEEASRHGDSLRLIAKTAFWAALVNPKGAAA